MVPMTEIVGRRYDGVGGGHRHVVQMLVHEVLVSVPIVSIMMDIATSVSVMASS